MVLANTRHVCLFIKALPLEKPTALAEGERERQRKRERKKRKEKETRVSDGSTTDGLLEPSVGSRY
jgi:hypothetical protein